MRGDARMTGTIQRTIPSVIADNTSFSGSPFTSDKTYTVTGDSVVVVSASSLSGPSDDYGTWQAFVYHNGTLVFGSGGRLNERNENRFGEASSCPISVSNGDTIRIYIYNTKGGTTSVYRRFLCFGCTVS